MESAQINQKSHPVLDNTCEYVFFGTDFTLKGDDLSSSKCLNNIEKSRFLN